MRKIFFTVAVVMVLMICQVSADYTLQVQGLTNSPSDGATVYLGVAPSAPVSTVNLSIQMIPTDGWLNVTEIYDYSGTAGTNQAYSYYIRVNNTQDYLVSTLSVATSERVFSNTTMGIQVFKGSFFEIKRIQPTWTTNPLTNIVGGYVLIDTPDEVDRGYPIYGMALSNSPADGATNYLGSKPSVPETVEGRSKIFIPTNGLLTQGHINDYSGTAGTAEAYSYYMDVNSTDYLIETKSVSAVNRFFDNNSMSVPVQVGNYLEFKRLHPTWVTNPLTNVVGGIAWINTTDVHNIDDGYLIHTFALTHTPGDAQTTYFGDRPIAPSTTGGTNKIYIRQDGWIRKAGVYSYSGTAGSAEPWTMYIRVNNTVDYLIQSQSLATNERMWINTTMNIPVVAGDYVEIKSVTSTMATNPATTIYGGGFYMEYEDDLPIAQFTSTTPYGNPPLVVSFTDTSYPTVASWDWYWTNVENSTTVHFNTTQNPVQSFDAGHFYVGLAVTNSSGHQNSTAGDYLISVSESGGYNGFTQQDIYLTGQYLVTFLITSFTTNLPISNVTIVDSVSGQSYASTNGTGFLTLPAGLYYVNFIADGYDSKQLSIVIDQNKVYSVKMVPSAPSPSKQQNTWYSPHQVRFEIWNDYGNKVKGITVNATANITSMPVNWLTDLYGLEPSVANDMLNKTLIMEAPTGDDGAVVYTMHGAISYDVKLTNPATGTTFFKTMMPKGDEYILRMPSSTVIPDQATNVYNRLSNTSLTFSEPNNSYVTMGLQYQDTLGTTTSLKFYVYFDNNKSVAYTANLGNPGTGIARANYTTKNIRGVRYIWNYTAVRS